MKRWQYASAHDLGLKAKQRYCSPQRENDLTHIPVLPCHLSGSFAALPPNKTMVRPRKIVLQIAPPLTFETMANQAAGWREICAVIHEQTLALQATTPHHATPHRGPISHRLVRTYRFARLLRYRRHHPK